MVGIFVGLIAIAMAIDPEILAEVEGNSFGFQLIVWLLFILDASAILSRLSGRSKN